MPNKLSQRDKDILNHMVTYCGEIDAAFDLFGRDEEIFKSNAVFRNAVSMPLQQIGELAKHFTDEFLDTYDEIPWKQVKGMREWFAHQYSEMNLHVIWHTATVDLLPLNDFCVKTLSANAEA